MNDPDKHLTDEQLEALLQPLRDVQPPAETQSANRNAVRQALAVGVRTAWWQRTVSVPVPLAIAASVLLLLAAISIIRPSAATQQVNDATPGTNSAVLETATPTWTIER